jgi:serine phosphatase RsbU (regulator of sigma subunit)/pSer/pThr/pTyr-binding forkhead associated (FHA) protein
MSLELIILTPDHQTRRMSLDGESISLGRAHSNDLCYPEDASLSRKHLHFEKTAEGWVAEDLGSKNGTLLNGERLATKRLLQANDRLNAGHLVITLNDPESSSGSGVVFVKGEGPEIHPDATVMTNLEGLLSGDDTAPMTQYAPPAKESDKRGQAFNTPVVRALVRAGRELAGDRPLGELFQLILGLSIEAVGAERGVLLALEGDQLVQRAIHGEGFRISTTVRDRVLKEKTSVLVRDLTQDEAFRQQISISEQHIQTIMAVPLQTEDRVIGLIYVDSRSFVHEFTPDDLNLLTVLANVAAIRIEHELFETLRQQEERRTQDLIQAAEIQRGILPRGAPKVPGVDLAGHNAPCRTVGGDYYDFITYPEGKVAVVLGDVAGKGMSAALLMSNLQARVQILAEATNDLAGLMHRLDQSIAANCPDNRFITMFFGLIDPATGRVVYTNAGHNPPLLVRATGEVERLEAMGTVLGILPEIGYEEQYCEMRPGDLLAVYSDGVTEAEHPEQGEFGEERLAEMLAQRRDAPAVEIVADVIDAVADWSEAAPPADDITLVITRLTG